MTNDYIKIETLHGKNHTEIHIALREGHVTINNDRRPKTTDEQSVKLVVDFLAKDH
jgi:hypothetical protein